MAIINPKQKFMIKVIFGKKEVNWSNNVDDYVEQLIDENARLSSVISDYELSRIVKDADYKEKLDMIITDLCAFEKEKDQVLNILDTEKEAEEQIINIKQLLLWQKK